VQPPASSTIIQPDASSTNPPVPISTTAVLVATSSPIIPTSSNAFPISTGTETSAGISASSSSQKNTPASSIINTAALLSILQSGVPSSAQDNAAAACFLNRSYTAFYSTPSWYSDLPSSAQSYFSSLNAGNVAACSSAAGADSDTSKGSGLSTGAKAGIAVGAIAGVAIVALMIWLMIAKFTGGATSGTGGTASGVVDATSGGGGGTSGAVQSSWNGVTGWDGVVGSAAAQPAAHHIHTPLIPVVGGTRLRKNVDRPGMAEIQQEGQVIYEPPLSGQQVRDHRIGHEADGRQVYIGSEIGGNPLYELGHNFPPLNVHYSRNSVQDG
jgi:hypothetical protein